MRGRATANWLAALSAILALEGLLVLLFWPGLSIVEENGAAKVLAGATPPVALAFLGLLTSFSNTQVGKFATWAAAILLLTFTLVYALTIGWAYVPAAFVLLVSALFLATRVGRPIALATAVLLVLLALPTRDWLIAFLFLPAVLALLVAAAAGRTASPGTSPA